MHKVWSSQDIIIHAVIRGEITHQRPLVKKRMVCRFFVEQRRIYCETESLIEVILLK